MSKITFHGGAGSVTGANFLLDTGKLKILVDCGFTQGAKAGNTNYEDFAYDPSEVDFLFITHAHLDHIGRIPKLVRDGFKGTIYSTPSTKEIAMVVFEDNVRLLAEDAKKRGLPVMYDDSDVAKASGLWKTVTYHTETSLGDDVNFLFKDAGHILGSVMVEISRSGKKFVFTGDLGNSPTPFLRDTEMVDDADYLLIESVYGDRNHENSPDERTQLFTKVIKDTINRKGILIIPAFSIERTQIILYELHKLFEDKVIPVVPVFLDSPLAIKVTEIYRRKEQNFKEEVRDKTKGGHDIFDFPRLKITPSAQESRSISKTGNPKIIIAGSGMSHGGRVISHEKMYLGDPNNTLLFVGYQVAGNLGRQIQDGVKKVRIDKQNINVRAHIESISGFSAHKDSENLVKFVEPMSDHVKKVFVAMGEPKSSLFLTQRLRDYLGVDAIVPKKGQIFEIDF